jgi:hypothetical protein
MFELTIREHQLCFSFSLHYGGINYTISIRDKPQTNDINYTTCNLLSSLWRLIKEVIVEM